MDDAKYQEVIEGYRRFFAERGIIPVAFPHKLYNPRPDEMLAHCAQMLPKMEQFLAEGRVGKVNRWLGFIQGVLWSRGLRSLDDLKNVNRPSPPPSA